MMKIYLGFDDTDTKDSEYGTGKLVRRFIKNLPEQCECLGIVRQQLLINDAIPYTSHNSAACLIAELFGPDLLPEVTEKAISYIEDVAVEGSDPGLCVVTEADHPSIDSMINFGQLCTHTVSTQKQAMAVAKKVHLSGHGGTNDGIIGAVAAVGLTISGWAGRFIEYGDMRNLPDEVRVSKLTQMGIEVVSMERDAVIPAPNDTIISNGWIRPRLLGWHPVLFVNPTGKGLWKNVYWKRHKKSNHMQNKVLFGAQSNNCQSYAPETL